MNDFEFKYFCSWYQYLVVIGKIEQFQHDHVLKPKSKEYYYLLEFNSINDLKLKSNEIIAFKFYEWFVYSNIGAVDICFTRFKDFLDSAKISFFRSLEESCFHRNKTLATIFNSQYTSFIQISILKISVISINFQFKVHQFYSNFYT